MNHSDQTQTGKEVNQMANQPVQSTINWARNQIQARLNEWDQWEKLSETGPHDEAFDQLEERIDCSFQEIMKIAFVAQLDLEHETMDLTSAEAMDTVLSLIHHLTGDPTDVEVVVRD